MSTNQDNSKMMAFADNLIHNGLHYDIICEDIRCVGYEPKNLIDGVPYCQQLQINNLYIFSVLIVYHQKNIEFKFSVEDNYYIHYRHNAYLRHLEINIGDSIRNNIVDNEVLCDMLNSLARDCRYSDYSLRDICTEFGCNNYEQVGDAILNLRNACKANVEKIKELFSEEEMALLCDAEY